MPDRYVRELFTTALERWHRGEGLVMLFLGYVLGFILILAGALGWVLASEANIWLAQIITVLGFAWVCFSTLILAPYELWKAKTCKIDQFLLVHDRTGKHDIDVNKALEQIFDHYSKTSLKGKPKEEIYKKAAIKIRELGFENLIRITGSVYDENKKTFADFEEPIPPQFWKTNGLYLDVIQNDVDRFSQTYPDNLAVTGVEYGRIKMNGPMLNAMFPEVK